MTDNTLIRKIQEVLKKQIPAFQKGFASTCGIGKDIYVTVNGKSIKAYSYNVTSPGQVNVFYDNTNKIYVAWTEQTNNILNSRNILLRKSKLRPIEKLLYPFKVLFLSDGKSWKGGDNSNVSVEKDSVTYGTLVGFTNTGKDKNNYGAIVKNGNNYLFDVNGTKTVRSLTSSQFNNIGIPSLSWKGWLNLYGSVTTTSTFTMISASGSGTPMPISQHFNYQFPSFYNPVVFYDTTIVNRFDWKNTDINNVDINGYQIFTVNDHIDLLAGDDTTFDRTFEYYDKSNAPTICAVLTENGLTKTYNEKSIETTWTASNNSFYNAFSGTKPDGTDTIDVNIEMLTTEREKPFNVSTFPPSYIEDTVITRSYSKNYTFDREVYQTIVKYWWATIQDVARTVSVYKGVTVDSGFASGYDANNTYPTRNLSGPTAAEVPPEFEINSESTNEDTKTTVMTEVDNTTTTSKYCDLIIEKHGCKIFFCNRNNEENNKTVTLNDVLFDQYNPRAGNRDFSQITVEEKRYDVPTVTDLIIRINTVNYEIINFTTSFDHSNKFLFVGGIGELTELSTGLHTFNGNFQIGFGNKGNKTKILKTYTKTTTATHEYTLVSGEPIPPNPTINTIEERTFHVVTNFNPIGIEIECYFFSGNTITKHEGNVTSVSYTTNGSGDWKQEEYRTYTDITVNLTSSESIKFYSWNNIYSERVVIVPKNDHTLSVIKYIENNITHCNLYIKNNKLQIAISKKITENKKQDKWYVDIYEFDTTNKTFIRKGNESGALSKLSGTPTNTDFISYYPVK